MQTKFLVMLLLTILATPAATADDANLLPQGQFSAENAGKFPKGWDADQDWMKSRVRVTDDGERTAAVFSESPAIITASMPVDATWKQLTLTFDAAVTDYAQGNDQWAKPVVGLQFLGADGKRVGKPKNKWFDTSKEWDAYTLTADVPDGAQTAVVRIQLKSGKGTSLKVANMKLAAPPAE